MVKKKILKGAFVKVVSERYPLHKKRGGGQVKIEAWENKKGEIVKYSFAYVNHAVYPGDNGRVFGYDNTHGFHHKHYFGEIAAVEDFKSYEDLLERFEIELRTFIQ